MILPHNVQIMPESTILKDWTILSLRPQNQHALVHRAAKRWHASSIGLSAYKLVAQTNNMVALHAALSCPIRIANSPAAVHYAQQCADLGGDWFAIGNSTARRLFHAGAHTVHVPASETTEGLLSLDALQCIEHTRIGILTAPDGRGELERVLITRGAALDIAHVYTRQTLCLNERQLTQIDMLGQKTAVLISSQKAFAHIWTQLHTARQAQFKTLTYVTSSERLLEYLKALGMTRIVCAQSTLPDKQISALAEAITWSNHRSNG
jgi:uroporphyrinogen-III synthase